MCLFAYTVMGIKKKILWQFVDNVVQVQGLSKQREQQGVVSSVIYIIVLLIKLINIIHTHFME